MESKIVIFESGIEDGIMSNNAKFYDKSLSQEEINKIFLRNRITFGKKYGIDGQKIYRATQKNDDNNLDYGDGKYIVIDINQDLKDAWYEVLEADILLLQKNSKKIALAHQMADCPIIIAEDRRLGVTSLSHCGARYINRSLPQQTIEALKKEYNSNIEDIYVYIGSCAKKENYIYKTYPEWATNKHIWHEAIHKEKDGYHIDMIKAIKQQLKEIGIKHLKISPNDTITNKKYYSHAGYTRGRRIENGQNIVGFFYKKDDENNTLP